jgi:hypothetical protein
VNPQLPDFLEVQEHCHELSLAIGALWIADPSTVFDHGETFEWPDAADWLDIAAGVTKLTVITSLRDRGVVYDEFRWEHENQRSELLSQVVRQVTVFQFAWGAFETVAKIVNPPKVPKHLQVDGNDSLIARVAHHISGLSVDAAYHYLLCELRDAVLAHPGYESIHDRVTGSLLPIPGTGIDLVRLIRNKFAHGAGALPQCGCQEDHRDMTIIQSSTQLVLLTIQLLVRRYFAGKQFPVWDDVPDGVCTVFENLHLGSYVQ